MKLQRKILFPTAVYFKDIPNAKELNKYLFKEIKKWRKADPEGEKKTNSGFGWHSTHTTCNIPQGTALARRDREAMSGSERRKEICSGT